MKIIKRILFVLLGLIVLVLVLALFAPREFEAGSDIVIDRPKQDVFDYVRYLKNQENFGVWYQMDTAAKRSYAGTDGTVGFTMEWDGDKIGTGKQVITAIDKDGVLESDLFFMGSDKAAKGRLAVEVERPHVSKVIWSVKGESPYPFNLMNWFIDMDKDFDQGLRKLKEILESRPETGSKEYLISYFNQTTERLINSVSGLSPEQLQFKPAEDRWSISQCLEHIVAAEKLLFEVAKNEMEKPAQPDRKTEVAATDEQLIANITDRSEKFQAPEELQPKGIYNSSEEALNALQDARSAVLEYINQADIDTLRNHIVEAPGGVADGYQSLLFIAGHCARHTLQIDEVKSAPGFPKK